MSGFAIAIIGAGPRSLNVIERLCWKLRQQADLPSITVHLIDPGVAGAGAHPPNQSQLLLTNTLASQVTSFSAINPDDPQSGPSGPSFTEWATAAGYRRVGARYEKAAPDQGEPIGDLDYLPRAMLGEYLSYSFRKIVAEAPARLKVVQHRQVATDITTCPETVVLEDGTRLPFNALIVATGHCETMPGVEDRRREAFVERGAKRNAKLAYFPSVYPTEKLADIKPDAVVAVQGLGLTAYDVIAELTVGRGGKFEGEVRDLRYCPSGQEPKILLFSRQSLPYDARGINQKGIDGGHVARFLTASAVGDIRERRRRQTGDARLDFVEDIMPLLRKEMAFGFRSATTGKDIDPQGFLPTDEENRVIDRILSARHLLEADSLAGFQHGVVAHLRSDLSEALKGNVSSPFKAATDTIRDLRAGLCAAIEYGGLLPQSHRHVVENFIAMTNRVTFGPPLIRNAELLALIDAGIVAWAGGPGARVELACEHDRFTIATAFPQESSQVEADVLIIARVSGHKPLQDMRGFSRQLIANGFARPFRNGDYEPYGLDVDRRLRLVRADGSPNLNAWAIGYVTEGPRFHTHALPRPGRASTQLSDAKLLVDDLLATLCQKSAPQKQAAEPLESLS
ncbi:FAD/NAD(P)-binding protein [Rhizobium sp. FKY42]|uniref:FAD/NAD(P)-binding protein n=1 Tax=Rhizobium sp. FKY42 TaxID=2562310 RepID=UPI00148550D9|nr:FAD/NAD(P)-binding protein [Rhizobium sp. FKY42]